MYDSTVYFTVNFWCPQLLFFFIIINLSDLVYSHPHCCFKPARAAIGQVVCNCQIVNNNNIFVCVCDIKKNEWSPQNALFMDPACQTRLVNLNRPFLPLKLVRFHLGHCKCDAFPRQTFTKTCITHLIYITGPLTATE